MTSPLAIVGLTYDAEDVQLEDLSIFLEIVKGLDETPAVRGKDSVVPALAGRTERNRKNDVLAIELRGHVTADPTLTDPLDIASSFEEKKAFVRALFASNRTRADLVATPPDTSTRTISARPMPGIIWDEKAPGLHTEVSIVLEGYGDWVVT